MVSLVVVLQLLFREEFFKKFSPDLERMGRAHILN